MLTPYLSLIQPIGARGKLKKTPFLIELSIILQKKQQKSIDAPPKIRIKA
jgi:hypothetical protein